MGKSAVLARLVSVCAVTALAGGALAPAPANAVTPAAPALSVATPPDTSVVRGDVVTTRGEARVTCLRITIAGVSPGGRATVTVTGPKQRSRAGRVGKRYSKVIHRSRTLRVVPGVYRVTSRSVAAIGGTDVPKVTTKKLRVRKNYCTGFTVLYQFVASGPVVQTCASSVVGGTGPGGGKVFYVDMTRPAGSQCFEAAPTDWDGNVDNADPPAAWGCPGTDISGATATEIGTGDANTTAIVAGCTPGVGIAARLADDYAGGSQTDWFLPSRDELNQLCKYARNQSTAVANQTAVCGSSGSLQPGFADWYWSSSQFNPNIAWYQDFNFGTQGADGKDDAVYPVRPVRAF